MTSPSPFRVLVVATTLAALVAPLPALAQESPTPTGCPNVASTTSQEALSGPADTPVTLRFFSDVQPARTPDRWTLTRVSPGPVEVVQSAPSSPEVAFTVSVAETTTFRVDAESPEGCGPASATFTRTVTSANPTPTPTPHADRACPTVTVAQPPTITSGQTVDLVVSVDRTSASSTATLIRESPAPRALVRGVRTADRTVTFTVRLGETHRFRAQADDGQGCLGGGDATFTAPVRAAVAIAATRNAVRTYTFSGRVVPARGQDVTLYRVTADGSRVITSRTTVAPDGTYRIDRRFTGSGRFGFLTTVAATSANLSGSSPVRPTTVS